MAKRTTKKVSKTAIYEGSRVWCVDDKLRLLYGVVRLITEGIAQCSMADQNRYTSYNEFEYQTSVEKLKILNR